MPDGMLRLLSATNHRTLFFAFTQQLLRLAPCRGTQTFQCLIFLYSALVYHVPPKKHLKKRKKTQEPSLAYSWVRLWWHAPGTFVSRLGFNKAEYCFAGELKNVLFWRKTLLIRIFIPSEPDIWNKFEFSPLLPSIKTYQGSRKSSEVFKFL